MIRAAAVSARTVRRMNANTDYLLSAVGLWSSQQFRSVFCNNALRCGRANLYGFVLFLCIFLFVQIPFRFKILVADSMKSPVLLILFSAVIAVTGGLLSVLHTYRTGTSAGLWLEQ